MKLHSDGIPIIEVILHKSTQVKFYCPYCRSWHYHGKVFDENGFLGHRVAHCYNEGSPYLKSGYYLKLKER